MPLIPQCIWRPSPAADQKCQTLFWQKVSDTFGFTLVELLIGAALLVLGIVTMLGVLASQFALNEQARNASWALNDATRIMEYIRRQNSGSACQTPSAAVPGGFADWDAWLADTSSSGGGGKSVQPDPAANELIVVNTSGTDPLTITLSVCWRQRARTIGECAWENGALSADESLAMADDTAEIDSPVMLSTLVTCR